MGWHTLGWYYFGFMLYVALEITHKVLNGQKAARQTKKRRRG